MAEDFRANRTWKNANNYIRRKNKTDVKSIPGT